MDDSTCSVSVCNRPVRLAGMCGAHHQRKIRWGDVREHIPLKGTDVDPAAFWCSKCHTHQPKANFHAEPRARRGISGVCKVCVKKHRDTIRDRIREQGRRAKAKDPERTAEIRRRSRLKEDPIKRAERSRAWRAANPEKVRATIKRQNVVRTARTLATPGIATTEQVAARWAYYGGKCWMCGDTATDTDHVKPLAKGGCNWPSNLRPACRRCNRSKSAKWPYDPRGTHGSQPTERQIEAGS